MQMLVQLYQCNDAKGVHVNSETNYNAHVTSCKILRITMQKIMTFHIIREIKEYALFTLMLYVIISRRDIEYFYNAFFFVPSTAFVSLMSIDENGKK